MTAPLTGAAPGAKRHDRRHGRAEPVESVGKIDAVVRAEHNQKNKGHKESAERQQNAGLKTSAERQQNIAVVSRAEQPICENSRRDELQRKFLPGFQPLRLLPVNLQKVIEKADKPERERKPHDRQGLRRLFEKRQTAECNRKDNHDAAHGRRSAFFQV